MYSSAYAFISLGGLKDNALSEIEKNYQKVVIATDNDCAGNDFANKHSEHLRLLPPRALILGNEYTKDWNDVLKFGVHLSKGDFSRVEEYCFGEKWNE